MREQLEYSAQHRQTHRQTDTDRYRRAHHNLYIAY